MKESEWKQVFRFHIADEPLTAVVRGAGKVIDNLKPIFQKFNTE